MDRDETALSPGSEMGRSLQSFDWSCHPLGPVVRWPQTLRTLVDLILASRDAMWIGWGPELCFFCNDAWLSAGPSGRASDQVVGRSAREVWGEQWKELETHVDSVLATGVAAQAGAVSSCNPIPGEGDTAVLGVWGVVTRAAGSAVTRWQRAETQARESEQRLRLATSAGKMGLWEWDVVRDHVTWTESLYPIHGVDPAAFEPTVKGFSSLVHPDDRAMVAERIRRTLEEDAPYEIEFRVRRPDGGVVWLFANATVVRKEGRPTRMLGAVVDITERKQAADALAESEQRFARFMRHLPGLAWIKDEQGRYVFTNDSVLRVFGVSAADLLGRTDAEVLPPDTAEAFQRNDQRALASEGGVQTIESLQHRDDGRIHHSLVSKFPIPAADGRPVLVGGMAIDITEKRDAEIATQRLAAIVSSSEDAILSKDLSGTITSWNRGAERLFGYTAAEMIGQPVLRLIPADRQGEEAVILDRMRRKEAIDHYETVRQRKDGSLVNVSLSVSPLTDATGNVVGASKIARDITAAKRAEAELRQREQIYRAIGESIDYGIWVCDASGRNTYASESFLRLTGLTQAECSDVGWARVLHPDEADATIAAWLECARSGRVWECEHRIRGVDGAWHPVLARGVPVRDEHGTIVSWAGINLDLSRLKRNEEALRRKTHNLEVLNRVGRTLAADRDLEKVVQAVTDAGREVSGAAFGAFFYNTRNDAGDSFLLSALSGARKKDFERFGVPRNTPLFGPTFRGEGPVRIGDVMEDPRYGTMPPHHGMPRGHLPVRSYLAVPVVSRSGEVHGGLFYGHPEPDVFTDEAENLVVAIAAQAAIAIDNANLYRGMQREIQEHERAEEALRDSEERFRTLADNIAAFAWTADHLGWATWYNKRWYEYTGTTFADMQNRGWERIQHPDHVERVRRGLQRCLERGEVWEDTFPLRRHDGEYRWFLSRAVPIHDENGRVVRWFGTNTDITDQKAAEEKLRLRGARMQLLSEMLADLLGARDPETIVRELFPKVAAHLGVDTYFNFMVAEEGRSLRLHSCAGISEEQARSIATLEYGQAICGTVAQTRAAIVADDIQHSDYDKAALVRSWGIQTYACNPLVVGDRLLGTLSFASRTRPRFNDDELEFLRIVSQSAAVALDRLHTARALRQSEERFRTLADNIAQFAWTADPEGWINWYNRRWFDFTGTTLEQMEGWGWQKVHHPDHVDRVTEKFRRHIASGEVWEDTFPIRREDGEYRWFLSRAVPIRDAAGHVVRWFGTNTDITVQREAEFALERARDEALAASRAKDEFLAALSHELRTPLNPALLLASDAADNPALPDHVRADFESIRKNVSLEARLIDDLLDLTRISRGKLQLDFEEHDLHAILRDALATIQSDAADKRIVVTLELTAERSVVRGDAVRLQQVFWNVLKNAVKFTPADGRIEISTRSPPEDPWIEIRVTDSGIGLKEAEILRIFEAFSQGDHAIGGEAHRFGGLGLGLAISRMVVEMHGGTIDAASSGPGLGATFVVRLPLAVTSLSVNPPRADSPPPLESTHHPGGGRILLVEDHEPTRVALERLLRRRKFVVVVAGTMAEAQARLREEKFDLLISDIGLPDGSGCDLMRHHASPSALPGIALTGYGMEQDVVRSRDAGFAAHLTKPIGVAALDRAIAGALNSGKGNS